jgi:hypothetical protein
VSHHGGLPRRLKAAEAAYLERFGERAPVSSYLDHRRLPDVLFEAVERGERENA